ncbi:pyridoxal phosphate-dependent transferase [Lentinula edodes]|nr:pyridoxal phosphate-dependent transferase [Lentinula edodes]
MNIEQFRKAGYQAIDRICDYYYALQDSKFPVLPDVEPGYLRPLLPSSAPESGEDFSQIAEDYQKLIVKGYTHWQHPSFLAYFPAGFSFEGILGDLYASSVSNPGFNWLSSPSCTELESIVLDWASKMLGLSSSFLNASGVGGGCFQNTASEAALVAIIAARTAYKAAHPDTKLEDMRIYTSTQTHSLGLKAGVILGLTVRALEVTREDNFSLRGHTLRSALEEDKKKGLHPFILIATIGTTSSGAVDNIAEIRTVVTDFPDIKIHVDAAWAGMALVCPEFREMCYLKDINAIADSFSTNFHKWGLTNFDACPLWVRDRKYLIDALDITPPFLRTAQGDAGTVIDYRNWHLGLGRRYRSLKLWFVLRGYGVEGFQKHIRKAVDLNKVFVDLVSSSDMLSLCAPPSLALSVFRINPKPSTLNQATLPEDALNDLNKLFYGRISVRKDIFLTQTVLNGQFCIRLAIGSAFTQDFHIREAFEVITHEGKLTLEAWDRLLPRGP